MYVRAVRGATQLNEDTASEIVSKTKELLQSLQAQNNLIIDDIISITLTMTPDCHAEFPAVAARELGWTDVPLLCAQELDITTAMKRLVRVLVQFNTQKTNSELLHVYLHGTEKLRKDLHKRKIKDL